MKTLKDGLYLRKHFDGMAFADCPFLWVSGKGSHGYFCGEGKHTVDAAACTRYSWRIDLQDYVSYASELRPSMLVRVNLLSLLHGVKK